MQGALWVLCGVAGSGKSSLAARLAGRLGLPCLDADSFHPPANVEKMRRGQPLDEADREPWLRAIEDALRAGAGAERLLAFPGLKAAHRARVLAVEPQARFAQLRVSLSTAQVRLRQRGGFFPPELAASQFEAMEGLDEAYGLDGEAALEALEKEALAWLRPGQAGVLGLGRMGLGIARRLDRAGFEVLGFDLDEAVRLRVAGAGLKVGAEAAALVSGLAAPRRLVLSLPAEAVGAALELLGPLLEPGDLVIDAANGDWRLARERSGTLEAEQVYFVDAGLSGGLPGEAAGWAVMAGGGEEAKRRARPLLQALAAPGGLVDCGPAGAGHYTKMAHNGMEYGLMQATAEGLALLQACPDYRLPLAAITRAWGKGAVVRSWLLELAGQALASDPALADYSGRVGENGSGRLAAEAARLAGLPMPALEAALEARRASRQAPGYASRLLSALRQRFGGHAEAGP